MEVSSPVVLRILVLSILGPLHANASTQVVVNNASATRLQAARLMFKKPLTSLQQAQTFTISFTDVLPGPFRINTTPNNITNPSLLTLGNANRAPFICGISLKP